MSGYRHTHTDSTCITSISPSAYIHVRNTNIDFRYILYTVYFLSKDMHKQPWSEFQMSYVEVIFCANWYWWHCWPKLFNLSFHKISMTLFNIISQSNNSMYILPCRPLESTLIYTPNNSDRHNITEILLKVAFKTMTPCYIYQHSLKSKYYGGSILNIHM